MPDLLSFKSISKSYRTLSGQRIEAITDVSFDLHREEVLGLIGPSGCGKSTLLRLIAGVESPSSGEVQKNTKQEDFLVGYVFQEPSLMRWRTIFDNIKLPLEVLNRKHDGKIDRLLELMNLSGFRTAYPNELSGGMQRRVAIARALVHEPAVLLMDEPFTGLDEMTRETLQVEVNRLVRNLKVTAVLVTHSIEEAVFLCDRILLMSSRPGKLIGEIKIDLPLRREPTLRVQPEFMHYSKIIREKLNLLRSPPQADEGVEGGADDAQKNRL